MLEVESKIRIYMTVFKAVIDRIKGLMECGKIMG